MARFIEKKTLRPIELTNLFIIFYVWATLIYIYSKFRHESEATAKLNLGHYSLKWTEFIYGYMVK